MYRLVEAGRVAGARYAQIGLRGYWPGPAEFAWQREHGIASFFMHDVRDLGIREVVARALAHVGEGPVYVTVDVDVLDPAFAPGTGTPEPGGMTSVDLLWAVREIAARVDLVGADVVEVLPTGDRLGGHHRARRGARRARAAHRSRSAKVTRSNGQRVATHSRTAASSTGSRPSSRRRLRTQSCTRTSCVSDG